MAQDYWTISAILASLKKIFNYAKNLIIKKKTKIINKNIYYIIYLRNWNILIKSNKKKKILFNNENQKLNLIGLEKKIIII
jgi:hypothetical protein